MRPLPSVGLRGMNKERVAQIDAACRSVSPVQPRNPSSRLSPRRRARSERRACLAIGQQLPRDGGMRALPDPRGRIISSQTSENRNSISNARPLLFTLARHSMKFGLAVPKLTSTCQPSSPGDCDDGKRIGKVAKAPWAQASAPRRPADHRRLCRSGVFAASMNGGVALEPDPDNGLGPVFRARPADRPISRTTARSCIAFASAALKVILDLDEAVVDEGLDLTRLSGQPVRIWGIDTFLRSAQRIGAAG